MGFLGTSDGRSSMRSTPVQLVCRPQRLGNASHDAKTYRLQDPTAGCVDTDLPVGRCNYARSDKSVGEIACLHHAMWVDHTETCCMLVPKVYAPECAERLS